MGMSCDSKYQVTPEGLIFTIQNDGTIRRIANISPEGNVVPICAIKTVQKEVDLTEVESEKKNKGLRGFAAFFIFILIVGLSCAIVYIVQCEDNKDYLNNRIYRLADEKQNLERELKVWADEYPIIITDIQVRNKGGEYGKTIHSKDTTYINPKIVYRSLDSRNIKLNVKIRNSSGNLSTGTGSENGYSYSNSVSVYKGDGDIELSGWGGANKGHWKAGRYGYEIWYEGKMLKEKVFYIK